MNRINIQYSITKDYSGLNDPKFVNALKIRNLILLPLENNQNYNLSVSDEIMLLDHNSSSHTTQKIVLDCGTIQLYDNIYQYFYIANGIYDSDHEYSLVINDQIIKLSKKMSPVYNAKLLIGSLILDDNYNHVFDQNIPILVNTNNSNFKSNITNILNKYNYYSPLKTNTILFLLDSNNTDILHEINNSYTNILVRPLYYRDFPLGSMRLSIVDYNNGVLNNESLQFKLFLNDNSFFIDGNSIYISNLTGGLYSVKIIDREGLLHIHRINNDLVDKEDFSFIIDRPQDIYTSNQLLSQPRDYIDPKQGFANLMINLFYDDPVEIFGPNDTHTMLNNGYQTLLNIIPGQYTIKQKDNSKSFKIYPNQNTTISSI